jgi:hypothetical protein
VIAEGIARTSHLIIQDLVEKRLQEGRGHAPFSRPDTYGDNETARLHVVTGVSDSTSPFKILLLITVIEVGPWLDLVTRDPNFGCSRPGKARGIVRMRRKTGDYTGGFGGTGLGFA